MNSIEKLVNMAILGTCIITSITFGATENPLAIIITLMLFFFAMVFNGMD